MDYVLIKDGTVENIIVADENFAALVASDWDHIEPAPEGVGIGWAWSDGSYTAPPAPEPGLTPEEPRHISVGAFFDRFGAAKWSILADSTPSVRAVVQDASVRQYIDLDNPQLPGGLQMLIDAGHEVDAQSIVDAPIQPGELP